MSTEFRCQACNGTFEGTPLRMQFTWPSSCERGNGTYDVCEACAKIFGIEKSKKATEMLFDTKTIDAQPVARTFFAMPPKVVIRLIPPYDPSIKHYYRHVINRGTSKLECPFPGCTSGKKL
jgi:hypothetical protein